MFVDDQRLGRRVIAVSNDAGTGRVKERLQQLVAQAGVR